MCPWNLPLEWTKTAHGRYEDQEDGLYNASAMRRMDALIELAKRHGIYVMLTLDFHGALRTEPDFWGSNNFWLSHPYNVDMGGSCGSPAEFFTDPEARRRYENRLRYLVARWGYSPQIAAWELWNEVDHVMEGEGVPAEDIAAWHGEMANYLKKVDPCGHLVTTSISHRPIALAPLRLMRSHVSGQSFSTPASPRRNRSTLRWGVAYRLHPPPSLSGG